MDRKVTFTGEFFENACVNIPASKSYVHRMALCAALADGKSVISNVNFSNDINATLDCIKILGCSVNITDDKIEIKGGKFNKELSLYNCGESASTLRFIIPIVLSAVGVGKFVGSETLLKRPLDTYFKVFGDNNIEFDYKTGEYLYAKGDFIKDEYFLNGDVSSQFITGMLLALSHLGGKRKINIVNELLSKPYIDITLEVMEQFGVNVDYSENTFTIQDSTFKPQVLSAQGDYSQSAFFLVAAMLGGKIELGNLPQKTSQGDSVIVDLLKRMGGRIERCGDRLIAYKSELKSMGTIDAKDFPDIVPPLALLCTRCLGDTVITNVSRLKIKESDRILATANLLNTLGADVKFDDNNIYIKGDTALHGGTVSSVNDHRIAMTAAVASIASKESIIIEESESVKKSYPKFFEDFVRLGGIKVE